MAGPADLDRMIGECLSCRYDLRGNTSGRCPECGRNFAEAAAAAPNTPWLRPSAGRLLALFATAVTSPRSIAADAVRPVAPAPARGFRRAVAGAAWLGTSASILPVCWDWMEKKIVAGTSDEWIRLSAIIVLFVAVRVGLTAAAGSCRWLLHPRGFAPEHAERINALTGYSCAPLLLLLAGAITAPVAVCTFGSPNQSDPATAGKFAIAAFMLILCVVGVVLLAVQYGHQRRLMRRPRWLSAVLALVAVATTATVAGVMAGAVAVTGGYLLVIRASFL